MSREWRHGVFGCFGDCTTCLLTYFCPCYIFGKNAESVGESCCCYSLLFFVPFINFWCAVILRSRIRAQKGINGSCLGDFCCTWCFPFCTLVQSAREVRDAPGGLYMVRE